MYAPRSARLIGQVLDGLVAVAPLLVILVIQSLGEVTAGLFAIAWVAWVIFYFLLADGLPGGQSLGKRILNIRVVDAGSGEPCTFWQSFVRNLLLSVLGPLDWIFIFGERHQRLGDKAAGTIVIPA
jgi:uncharacterized RDD family membrane protein YckC